MTLMVNMFCKYFLIVACFQKIIFKKFTVEKALLIAHQSLFVNAGQTCIAPTRVFVQSKIYDHFVKRSVELASKVKVGGAFVSDSFQGPQVYNYSFLNYKSFYLRIA